MNPLANYTYCDVCSIYYIHVPTNPGCPLCNERGTLDVAEDALDGTLIPDTEDIEPEVA